MKYLFLIEKYWVPYNILTDSQPQQNLRWELGLANKLWMIFSLIITLLLPLNIAFNDYREKALRQEPQYIFENGLLTCCGFECRFFHGFAVDSH
jgi:hypothetical protein